MAARVYGSLGVGDREGGRLDSMRRWCRVGGWLEIGVEGGASLQLCSKGVR